MTRVIIIGAGLAGLTCGKVLQERGISDFVVLEKQQGVGGRVRTDLWQGFHLDRGFQVLFTAYPAVRRHLNLQALELRSYRRGAVLVRQGQSYLIGDPLRELSSLWASLGNPLIPAVDKARILQLRLQLSAQSPDQILQSPEQTTRDFIQGFGFSDSIFQRFLQPLYRGILLDPDLNTSSRLFKLYFKMLAEGDIVTPRLGLGQISEQLAAHVGSERIRDQTEVVEILQEQGRAVGVRTAEGEEIRGEWIICAADALTVGKLLGVSTPDQPRSVTCCYFSSPLSLTQGGYIHLNSDGQGIINNCVQLTQVSPDLAPKDQHLYSVVVLGYPDLSEQELVTQCFQELQAWFPDQDIHQLQFLRSYRIPFAQFDQPPGVLDHLPDPQSPIPRVILAGEYTQHSSIEGAIRSGEQAADLVPAG